MYLGSWTKIQKDDVFKMQISKGIKFIFKHVWI